MTECKQEVFEFQVHGSRKVTADFSGGYLSSEGGAVFLRGVDLKMGLIERLAGCFSDYRLPSLVEHKVAELLRQRIGALALGYEDLNDHDRLRLDPLHALLAGKADVLGEDRLCEGDKGKALAAQQDLFADRTSTSWMASNQLRLWFSAFARLMLSVLRADVLRDTDLAAATLGQIRLKLFKIGARIKISCRRIHLELASAYPYQEIFWRACANLCAMPAG